MNLATYLEKKNITQGDFAAEVGCSQGRIAQLIAGDTPSMKLAQRIAAATKNAVPLAGWGDPEQRAA